MPIHFSKKQRLLSISDSDKLAQNGIYRNLIAVFVNKLLTRQLEPLYIVAIKVTYADGEHKVFDIYDWVILSEGILKNMYYKGLCKIKFITYHKPYNNKAEFEKRFGKIDTTIMIAAQKIAKKLKKKTV